MSLPIVVAGQPLEISASDWNALLAIARQWQQGKTRRVTAGLTNLHNGMNAGGTRLTRVLLRNDSGSDVPPLGVLAMQEPLRATTDEDWLQNLFETPQFKGITPSSSYWGKWAVLQEPAPYENANPAPLYWAIASGVTWANVNIVDDQDVAVEHNNVTNELNTGMHGSARILWKPSGTGTGKIALIQMGDWVADMIGKTDAAITKGSSGTISIWLNDRSADTNVNVTAFNAAGNIAITKWVGVKSYLGNLVIVWAECP